MWGKDIVLKGQVIHEHAAGSCCNFVCISAWQGYLACLARLRLGKVLHCVSIEMTWACIHCLGRYCSTVSEDSSCYLLSSHLCHPPSGEFSEDGSGSQALDLMLYTSNSQLWSGSLLLLGINGHLDLIVLSFNIYYGVEVQQRAVPVPYSMRYHKVFCHLER